MTVFRLLGPLLLLVSWFSFASAARAQVNADAYLVDELIVEQPDGATNHVRIYGKSTSVGRWVTIIPSLGRGVEDYTEAYRSSLTTKLAEAGYRVVLVQPRGIGKSSGDLNPERMSMALLANDLATVFDAIGADRVRLIGHAFGNRLARVFATAQPDRVSGLVLVASGGDFELNAEQRYCLSRSFDLSLERMERLEAIGCAFFATGNDPSIWFDGWYPKLAAAQIVSATSIKSSEFKAAGGLPFMLIQPGEDFIAPPDLAGRKLAAELPDQVTYAEIPIAGHAITSEQPDLVANLIIAYFSREEVDAN